MLFYELNFQLLGMSNEAYLEISRQKVAKPNPHKLEKYFFIKSATRKILHVIDSAKSLWHLVAKKNCFENHNADFYFALSLRRIYFVYGREKQIARMTFSPVRERNFCSENKEKVESRNVNNRK